jgi:hypothetical protein
VGIRRLATFSSPARPSTEIRLVIDGDWHPSYEAEMRLGGFDILVLHYGDYKDFSLLAPYADKIKSLQIGADSKSARGLDALTQLESLIIMGDIGKDLDLRWFPHLKNVEFEESFPSYAKTLFHCQSLEQIRIHRYDQTDCVAFGQLQNLRKIDLRQGGLRSLNGLSACAKLESISLTHLRNFTDVSEIERMPNLRDVHFDDCLPKLTDISAVIAKTDLTSLIVMGLPITMKDISWLQNFNGLQLLRLHFSVDHIDWHALFTSSSLQKVVVCSSKPSNITDGEIRAIALEHKLVVSRVSVMGTKKSPGWFIEFAAN